MQSLKNKKIILGVTGGIAAYKACELVRLLRKQDCEVRVIMTKSAESFVGPLSFHSLSGNVVVRADLAMNSDLSATAHIDLAQWGDIFVIAPTTANVLAKLANGICDDSLTIEALAFQGPIVVVPAMNTRMWTAQVTQENLQRIRDRGVKIIEPQIGSLACGEFGAGKMEEPAAIVEYLAQQLSGSQILHGCKVVITSGPTRAYIDSIRFITNRSSGRMGHALARMAEDMGAEVSLITGPVDHQFAQLERGNVFKVETNEEMLKCALKECENAQFIFGAAAVCDFDVKDYFEGKIARSGDLSLLLESSVDILGELTKNRKPGQVFVGFAAEPGDHQAQMDKARRKLESKRVDFIAMNDVSRADVGFDVDTNEMHVFEQGTEVRYSFLARAPKTEIAKQLLGLAAQRRLQ